MKKRIAILPIVVTIFFMGFASFGKPVLAEEKDEGSNQQTITFSLVEGTTPSNSNDEKVSKNASGTLNNEKIFPSTGEVRGYTFLFVGLTILIGVPVLWHVSTKRGGKSHES